MSMLVLWISGTLCVSPQTNASNISIKTDTCFFFSGDNKSSESIKLTIFCKYNLLLIDSFEKITEFYKANERNKISPERVLNDEETKVFLVELS
jgi:hypothetical protein